MLLTHQGALHDSFQTGYYFLHLVRSGGRPWAGPEFSARGRCGGIPMDFSWNFNPDTNEWEIVRGMPQGSDDAVEFSSPSGTAAEDGRRRLRPARKRGLPARGSVLALAPSVHAHCEACNMAQGFSEERSINQRTGRLSPSTMRNAIFHHCKKRETIPADILKQYEAEVTRGFTSEAS